ncbi:glycoside hydrolase family 27 [Trichoderma cornu-damae]|uniref:Glycoside hydrolase family 27 n=1 Tax=Trichoderma cornu-damae TaxID=654480 RepID=A0A9P8QSU2_9HYPO|nr:glycoside hydrolase family 27 [Trichoderma cornu-damae]
MDNLPVGNNATASLITDAQRQTVTTHYVGAGANLVPGPDLSHLDGSGFGLNLLTNKAAHDVANFTAAVPHAAARPRVLEAMPSGYQLHGRTPGIKEACRVDDVWNNKDLG